MEYLPFKIPNQLLNDRLSFYKMNYLLKYILTYFIQQYHDASLKEEEVLGVPSVSAEKNLIKSNAMARPINKGFQRSLSGKH